MRAFLRPPEQAGVDFRASCFCHKVRKHLGVWKLLGPAVFALPFSADTHQLQTMEPEGWE